MSHKPPAVPGRMSARQSDLDRYDRILDLQRQLERAPTLDEVWPILSSLGRLRRYARLCPVEGQPASPEDAPRGVVRRALRALIRRVGDTLGQEAAVASKLGTIVDKAVDALDEVLDPATRPEDPRMVKSLADAAAKTLEIAGHSREEKPATTTHVNVSVTKEESLALLRANQRVHELERAAAGVPLLPRNRLEA